MKVLLIALALLAQVQPPCPPGSRSCPNPLAAAPKARINYHFNESSGNPPPWATAVRITATSGREASFGSGTVIESGPGSSLVLTCAHVLRGRPTLVVEVFAGKLAGTVSSPFPLGPPTGRYAARFVAADHVLDVGLIRFDPGFALAVSPLIPEGMTAGVRVGLLSVGCSQGSGATAMTEVLTGKTYQRPPPNQRYRGIVTEGRPVPGRSGGGLFDGEGRLAGVCNFGGIEEEFGVYAPAESIRELLRREGLVELASGLGRKEPALAAVANPPVTVAIGPQASPPTLLVPQTLPPLAEDLAGKILSGLIGAAAVGVPALGLVGWLMGKARPKRDDPPAVLSAASSPSPEDLVRLLAVMLKARDDDVARRKGDADLLERFKLLIDGAKEPTPKP
jgi:hypothetical protein